MNLLLIDTSTDICSVAIGNENGILGERNSPKDFSHSEVVTIFISDCLHLSNLKLNDIDAVAIASGPGSYTGLRISASVAKGICFGNDIPLIAIDSLTSLAYSATPEAGELIIPFIDARRMDVYTATYDSDYQVVSEMEKQQVNEQFIEKLKGQKINFCGDGVEKCTTLFSELTYKFGVKTPSATYLLKPAIDKFLSKNFENLDYFSPQYLNKPNITTSKKSLI